MNDNFKLVFEAENVNGVISAHLQIAKAQDMVTASATAASNSTANASKKVSSASAATSAFVDSLRNVGIQTAFAIAGIVKLEDSYLKFARTVMDVRDLTGASVKEATQATLLARVSGMPDATALREILRSSAAAFKGEGQEALSQLGVAATPNESGLKLINDIANALQGIPDGLRKAEIEEKLFGARGVAAMQPLLRLTQRQREETMRLADDFNGAGLASAQQLTYSFNLLGQTMLQDVIFPIAQQMLPLFQGLTTMVLGMADGWHRLDTALGGVPSWIVGIVALSGAIYSVVRTVMALTKAYEALIAVQAISAALQGPIGWGRLAAGVAVAGAGLYGISKAFGDSGSGSDSTADKFSRSVDRFGEHVGMMQDAVSQMRGNGIPKALNSFDIGALSQSAALKTIG